MNLNEFITVPKWWFYFLILMELTSFLLSFVLWSFQVLGKDSMDYGIRSGKSLSLGMCRIESMSRGGCLDCLAK